MKGFYLHISGRIMAGGWENLGAGARGGGGGGCTCSPKQFESSGS
jgi:hypothetical protein